MRVRRLAAEEHGRTKGLYEEVFPEDKGPFADYYYQWKTRDNIIYAAEDEDGIHSMVQLNPFTVWVNGELLRLHYIVAVATGKEYRHRGLMRSLLTRAMEEMEQAGEPFTFLMPASEKIYLPFGFRYFSGQRKGILREQGADRFRKPGGNGTPQAGICQEDCCGHQKTHTRPIRRDEYAMTAERVNRILAGSYRVFIWRDEAYYERMRGELACQGGELMGVFRRERNPLAEDKEELAAVFYMLRGEEYPLEIREVIAEPEYLSEVELELRELARRRAGCGYDVGKGACMVYGCPEGIRLEAEEREPLLMARGLGGSVPGPPESIYINEIV